MESYNSYSFCSLDAEMVFYQKIKKMKYKCWKCEKLNEEQHDGYCFCPGCNLWYAPIKEQKEIREFLDDEERSG